MNMQHGWQPCRACHAPSADVRVEGEWHLRANPGYWGAAAPRTLVLGFSKGATQIAASGRGFDGVAFAGMRPRLRQVLETLGIDLGSQSIDELLSASGRVIGAASLVRCGLSLMENGRLVTSGTIMPKAVRLPFTRGVMSRCVREHLLDLPSSVERVVLLGTSDAYLKGVHALMADELPDYRRLNEVAFEAMGRTWVFAAHPSPANGTFGQWLAGDASTEPGRKRELAQEALGAPSSAQVRSAAAVVPTDLPPSPRSPSIHQKEIRPMATTTESNDERFAQTFHLARHSGPALYAVKMKDRDTGTLAFRVSKGGNTKADAIEVADEAELLQLLESGQYLVRAQPRDRSTPANLVHPTLKGRIVRSA